MMKKFNVKQIAVTAVYLAIALIIGTIETLIPSFIPIIPNFRIGLSNFVVLLSILTLGPFPALIIVIAKSCIVPLFFSNPIMIIYSLCASTGSYIITIIFVKIKKLGLPSISAISGIMHNFIQIVVATIITKSSLVFYYLPLLALMGGVSGEIIGIITSFTIKKLPQNLIDF